MGWFKKLIPKEIRKPVKAKVDPIIDLGASVVKAVISPFTGAFNLPDISIDTNIGTSEIKAATTVDFNGANRAVPVLYGTMKIGGTPISQGFQTGLLKGANLNYAEGTASSYYYGNNSGTYSSGGIGTGIGIIQMQK